MKPLFLFRGGAVDKGIPISNAQPPILTCSINKSMPAYGLVGRGTQMGHSIIMGEERLSVFDALVVGVHSPWAHGRL